MGTKRILRAGVIILFGFILFGFDAAPAHAGRFLEATLGCTETVCVVGDNMGGDLQNYLAGVRAVMIASIESDSAAAQAGLKVGDILLGLDGATIAGADDLVRALTGEKIERSVALDVLRGTERLTISLVPQERKRA